MKPNNSTADRPISISNSPVFEDSIILIPESGTQENIIMFLFITIKKNIHIHYYVDGTDILRVFFYRIIKGKKVFFKDKQSAEDWFGKTIKVSKYLNQKIITKRHTVYHHAYCPNCRKNFRFGQPIQVDITGPKEKVSSNVLIEYEDEGICPGCDSYVKIWISN